MNRKRTRYLLYAVGEITLVVVGILIAVQVDNWNNNKIERKKELSYLNSYAEDLKGNIRELDRVILKAQRSHQIADSIIHLFIRSQPIKQPKLDSMVYALVGYTLFLSNEGTTQNLLGAGSLEIIKNPQIRSSFVTQEADQKRLREVEKGVYETFVELLDYLKIHAELYNYQLDEVMIDEPTQRAMMSDKYFINVLDDVSFKYKDLERLYKKRQDELAHLLLVVEKEIDASN